MTRVLARLCASFACVACATVASAEEQPAVRWGVTIGLVGQLPVGGDVGQSGAPDDEFETGLAVQVEPFVFDVGTAWQLVPFLRYTVAGGANTAYYEDVFGADEPLAGAPERSMLHVGLGARVYPFGGRRLRAFVGGYLGYATAGATYQVNDLDPELIPEAFRGFIGATSEVRRHEGLGLTVGIGLRNDVSADVLGESDLIPLAVELQYTHNFWLGLEHNADRDFDEGLLAPEDMTVDFVGLMASIGFLR